MKKAVWTISLFLDDEKTKLIFKKDYDNVNYKWIFKTLFNRLGTTTKPQNLTIKHRKVILLRWKVNKITIRMRSRCRRLMCAVPSRK